jgi:hypothetical protein
MTRRNQLGVVAVERATRLAEHLSLRPVLDLLYALLWDGQYWRGVAAA